MDSVHGMTREFIEPVQQGWIRCTVPLGLVPMLALLRKKKNPDACIVFVCGCVRWLWVSDERGPAGGARTRAPLPRQTQCGWMLRASRMRNDRRLVQSQGKLTKLEINIYQYSVRLRVQCGGVVHRITQHRFVCKVALRSLVGLRCPVFPHLLHRPCLIVYCCTTPVFGPDRR